MTWITLLAQNFNIYLPLQSLSFDKHIRSVTQSCPTLCDPMNCSTPGLPVHHKLPEFTRLTSIESVMPSSHLILCHPLLLLPPMPPSIRVFSNESTLRMRWPKYWRFSFSIIPSKEIPGLIIFLPYHKILMEIGPPCSGMPQWPISKDPWSSRAGLLNVNTLDILDLVTCGGG